MGKKWLTILGFCLLVFIFFSIVFRFTNTSWQDVEEALVRAGYYSLLLVVTLMLTQLLIQSFSWRILIVQSGYKASTSSLASAIFVGWAANFITPSMYVGGEPLRAYILSKKSQMPFRKAIGSVLTHKFIEFASFMIFVLLSTIAIFYKFGSTLPAKLQVALIVCVVILTAFLLLVLLVISLEKRFFTYLIELYARLKKGSHFVQKLSPKIREMEDVIFAALHQHPVYSLFSLLLMMAFHLLILIRPLMFFFFLDIDLDFGQLALLFVLVQLLQALQFTPGGLGILESGMIGIMALIDISAAHALGYAAFCRVGDFVIVASGFTISAYYGLGKAMSNENFSPQ